MGGAVVVIGCGTIQAARYLANSRKSATTTLSQKSLKIRLGRVHTISGPTAVDWLQLAAAVMLAACCGMDRRGGNEQPPLKELDFSG